MSTTTFGEPEYDHAAGEPPVAEPNNAIPVDLNDPALTSEVLTDNAAADAYATPPPLPDGKHRAKVRQLDIKDANGQMARFAAFRREKMNNGQPFLATNLESSVIDHSGKHDGIKLTDYWVKSCPDRSGTSQAATILRALGVDLTKVTFKAGPGKFTQGELMATLLSELAKEPEVMIETAWKAECQSCGEKAKKAGERGPKPILVGMHRFPQLRSGGHDPSIQCPTCKTQVRAQARLIGYSAVAGK